MVDAEPLVRFEVCVDQRLVRISLKHESFPLQAVRANHLVHEGEQEPIGDTMFAPVSRNQADLGRSCHDACIGGLERMSKRTSYRILELPPGSHDLKADGIEVGRYDSAYHAMEDMRRECFRSESPPPNWYLLAPNEQVLLNPIDLLDMLS